MPPMPEFTPFSAWLPVFPPHGTPHPFGELPLTGEQLLINTPTPCLPGAALSSWGCPVILGLPYHPELAEGSPASPCVILGLPKDPQPRQVLTSEGYREHFQPFRQEPLLRGRQQTNRSHALPLVHAEQRNPLPPRRIEAHLRRFPCRSYPDDC